MADKLPPLPKGLTIVDDKLPPLPKGLTVVEEKKNRIQNAPPTGTQTSKSGSLPFLPQVSTKIPSVLTPKGQVGYQEQVKNYVPPKEVKLPKDETPDFFESIKNSLSNIGTGVQQFIPNTTIALSETLQGLLGKDLGSDFYRNIVGAANNPELDRQIAYAKLAELEPQFKKTRGLIESAEKFDVVGLAAATVDAMSSLVRTAITSVPTAGIGLASDMVGGSIASYNKEKAKSKGISVDELYKRGENEFAIPAAIGAIGTGLEGIGLKGTIGLINKKLTGSIAKKFATTFVDVNKEGLTEFTQTGLDAANNALAQGKSATEATSIAVDEMFSKKGLESYLMGSVGSAGAAGLGRVAKGMLPSNKKTVTEATQKISEMESELNNPNLSPATQEFISQNIRENVSVIADAIESDADKIEGLSDEQKFTINSVNEVINSYEEVLSDPNASEQTKNLAQERIDKLDLEIDNILEGKKVSPETESIIQPIPKPTFDTEEQLIEEGKTAEEEYKKTGDQVTYEQKIKELEEREKNLVPAPEDAEIGKPEEVVEVEPIRQLGTGANVYFETEKYRVNDTLKNGKVLLNIQSQTSEIPIANIEFDNANDAVIIAQELNNKFSDGVPDAILIDKYIEQLKNDLLKPQEDAVQEQGLQKSIKSTTFVDEEIKPDLIPEGSQKELRVDSKTIRNFKEKDTVERNNSSIQTWLESISRNDKKEKRNEGEELFGESVFSKESQAGVLLDDIYRKWQSLRAQTLDESKVGQDIGTTRTRTSLEQQRVGQQNRELAIIDELRAQETSQQDSEQGNISENSRKKQVEAGRMVEKILELSSLPNDPKKASVARALRDLLSSSTQKEKELIINEIKNKLYAVSQSISSKVPVLTEATVGEEVEQGKPQPKTEVVTEEGAKAEEVDRGKTKVYHGADIDFTIEGKRNRIMFTSKNKDYAQYYAKQRSGKLFEFDVEKSKIAKEEYVKNKIKSLGLKTEEGNLVETDDNLHRLIDPRFDDTAISKEGLDKLFSELEKEGYYGVDFMDENQELGGMNEIESIAIFNPKELVKATEKSTQEQTPAQQVEQLRASEQAELNAAIPNADQYKTDGKVDRAKITDAKDLEAFDKIYDKYDRLITPLLPKKEAPAKTAPKLKSKVATRFLFKKAVDLFYDISGTEGSAKKSRLARDRRRFMEQNPSIKYIDDNWDSISKQLEAKGLLTKSKGCP